MKGFANSQSDCSILKSAIQINELDRNFAY